MGNSMNPFAMFDREYLASVIPIEDVLARYAGVDIGTVTNQKRIKCPLPDHTGDRSGKNMVVYHNTNSCHCFSCGGSADSVSLARKFNPNSHLTDFYYQLAQDFGIPLEACSDIAERQQAQKEHRKVYSDFFPLNNTELEEIGLLVEPAKKELTSEEQAEQQAEFAKTVRFLDECKKHLYETNYHRGLSNQTLEHFGCGFDPSWQNPTNEYERQLPRLIIPTGEHSYLARLAVKLPDDKENDRFRCRKVGKVPIFNSSVLKEDKPVFVVEGEIDAMSFHDVGANAVGLGGTSGVNALLKTFEQEHPKQPIVVALDNDTAGRNAKSRLIEGLDRLGVMYIVADVCAPYKDANEALNADRVEFAKTVHETATYASRMKSKERYIPEKVKLALDDAPAFQAQLPAGSASIWQMWRESDDKGRAEVEATIAEKIGGIIAQYQKISDACRQECQALEAKYTPEQWKKNIACYEGYNKFVKENPTGKLHISPEILAGIKDAASLTFSNDIGVKASERLQHFTEMKEKVEAHMQDREKFYKENPPKGKQWGRG